MTYLYKRQPRAHQERAFLLSKDRAYYALFMEQRTGKTKVVLDTAAYLYASGTIDALLIVAPNGVHRNWITDELPKDLPDWCPRTAFIWRSGKLKTKAAQQALASLISFDGLSVLAVNTDALITAPFKAYIRSFVNARRVFIALDEADDFKTPGAKRTKMALALRDRCPVRRILTGTPAPEGNPLDLYAPTNFLRAGLLGFTSFFAYKQHFAEWVQGYNSHTGTEFSTIKRDANDRPVYKNLPELTAKLRDFSFRVTRAECADLPPKIYQKAYFELTDEQRRVYNQLREEYVAELQGGTVSAAMVLTRYLRLQQISSGYVPVRADPVPCPCCRAQGCDACGDLGYTLPAPRLLHTATNPRVEATLAALSKLEGQKVIVWARFQQDLQLLHARLPHAVRYDGTVSDEDRALAIKRFQADGWFVSLDRKNETITMPEAKIFLGNAAVGGRGLDLSAASAVINHSHYFSLRLRLQSEDRAQSLTKKDSVLYIDVVAEDTVDERIITALRGKKSVADTITGDDPRAWL